MLTSILHNATINLVAQLKKRQYPFIRRVGLNICNNNIAFDILQVYLIP